MRLRVCAGVLLAGGMSTLALAASTGVAQADSDGLNPATPGLINLVVAESPALLVDPADEGGPSTNFDGVGMYCTNLFVKCH